MRCWLNIAHNCPITACVLLVIPYTEALLLLLRKLEVSGEDIIHKVVKVGSIN